MREAKHPWLRALVPTLLGVGVCACPVSEVVGSEALPSIAEVQLVVQVLQDIHVRGSQVPPERYADAIPEFMTELDVQRMVFLETDRVELGARFGRGLHGDMLDRGRLDAAYGIFTRYASRAKARAAWVTTFLEREFDFSGNDTLPGDRTEAGWPHSVSDADDLWTRRLQAEILDEVLNGASAAEARRSLQQRYQAWIAALENHDQRDLAALFLTAVCRLYDGGSSYLPAEMFKPPVKDMAPGFAGIGAILRKRGEFTMFQEILPNGPAERSGAIHRLDRILAVGPTANSLVDVVGWRLVQVVDQLKGKPGSRVVMTTRAATAPDSAIRETVELTREMSGTYPTRAQGGIVQLVQPGSDAHHRWGVITLRTIYGVLDDSVPEAQRVSAARDVATLLERLEAGKVQGIALDLRSNTGGLLDEVVDVAGLFVGNQTIAQLTNTLGRLRQMRPKSTRGPYTGPLVVLVDGATSSGAEIIAGAVQDFGRGIVVGPGPTNANGTVQAFLELDMYLPPNKASSNAGGLRLTAQRLYRANGSSIQARGITPDILVVGRADAPEEPDPLTRHALPSDEIAPVPRGLAPFDPERLAGLRERSEKRQRTGTEFDRCRALADRLEELRLEARLLNLERRQKVRADYTTWQTEVQALRTMAGAQMTIAPMYLEADAPGDSPNRAKDSFHANLELLEAIRILADLTRQ